MIYEVGFVGCSFLVMLVIAYRFFHYKRVKSIKNLFFGFLIVMGMLEVASDIISAICVSYVQSIPLWIAVLTTQIFYLFQFVMPFCMFAFDFVLAGNPYKYRKVLLLCLLPLFFALIVWALNPFFHTLFYIDSSYTYRIGSLNEAVYISAGYYLFGTIIAALMLKEYMGKYCAYVMINSSMACITVVTFQMFNRNVLTTGVGIMLSILMMYLYLHNSDSITDNLTGCFERSALVQFLNGGLAPKKNAYAIVISLSGFRSVNTVFGASTGDEILSLIGHSLVNLAARNNDSDAYRIDGDIFLIVPQSRQDYLNIMDCIRKNMHHVFNINGKSIPLSIRVLKLENISYTKRKDTLISIIEFVIAHAKQNQLTGEILVDQAFRDEYDYLRELEQYLHEAIAKKSFYMTYQPIWSVKEQKFTMIEALVRLNHPKYGPIPPDKFILIAEQNGLVPEITNCVLEMVSDFIARNDLESLGIKNVKVNLSAMDLLDGSLQSHIEHMLEKHNVTPSMLSFEITETVATSLNKEVRAILNWMNSKGLSLSMDDFGSGYANLDMVMQLQFDVVKIDRTMLLAVDETKIGKDVYKTMVDLFQDIGVSIVSEGAETEEQVNLLASWGVDYIQGYYYSKPLREEELLLLLLTHDIHQS